MVAIDKSALLLAEAFGIEEVEIPGKGTVQIRSLSRAEALALAEAGDMSAAVMEQKLVSTAMVEPKLTEAEVAAWQAGSPVGELEVVTDAIVALSGMATEEGANPTKDAVKRFRK